MENLNVFGEALITCSTSPMTGYFRDGCCNTDETDGGTHTVCVSVTENFLEYSKAVGNDLSTPIPHYQFEGLKPGDKWCLCALRFKEAMNNDCAPNVILEATNEKTLDIIPLEELVKFALKK